MKRINISIPDTLHQQLKLPVYKNMNISAICARALREAMLKHWAHYEQQKLMAAWLVEEE